jgi:hypothetical protein
MKNELTQQEIIDLIDEKKEIYFKNVLKKKGDEHLINFSAFKALIYLKNDILYGKKHQNRS